MPAGSSQGGASHATAGRYLDTLVAALMVLRLEPYLANMGKRLVKSPKVYVRNSGMLLALLGLATVRQLRCQVDPVPRQRLGVAARQQVVQALATGHVASLRPISSRSPFTASCSSGRFSCSTRQISALFRPA